MFAEQRADPGEAQPLSKHRTQGLTPAKTLCASNQVCVSRPVNVSSTAQVDGLVLAFSRSVTRFVTHAATRAQRSGARARARNRLEILLLRSTRQHHR
jgi:hypothetical protein